jgi:integrase
MTARVRVWRTWESADPWLSTLAYIPTLKSLSTEVAGSDRVKILQAGEERALLAVAGPHLQRLIIGALETGMRLGELLRLQWKDVAMDERQITVRPETTKTRTSRAVPISARFHGVLQMLARHLNRRCPRTPTNENAASTWREHLCLAILLVGGLRLSGRRGTRPC